jgi:hypothetical protein
MQLRPVHWVVGFVALGVASVALDVYLCLRWARHPTGMQVFECTFWPVVGKGVLIALGADALRKWLRKRAHWVGVGALYALAGLAVCDSAFEWGGKDILFAVMEAMGDD